MADDVKESESEVVDDNSHTRDRSSSFLLEMNLLTVLLSSVSNPGDDGLNFDEETRKGNQDDEVKACISRIQGRRRGEPHELKLAKRPSQRFEALQKNVEKKTADGLTNTNKYG